MATRLCGGPGADGLQSWSLDVDDLGYRTYTAVFLLEADTDANSPGNPIVDGPFVAYQTAGLPLPGAAWSYFGDNDPNVWCRRETGVITKSENERRFYLVTKTFSNRPDNSCTQSEDGNPLLKPQEVSGSFVKKEIEAVRDRNGNLIKTRSHEMIRGKQNEWDKSLPQVKIKQNVVNLELPLLAQSVDTVNSVVMWGLPVRCWKLTDVSWAKQYYGTCNKYFTREFTFDADYNTHDRVILSEGHKVLKGQWAPLLDIWVNTPVTGYAGSPNPDPTNPRHYIAFQDLKKNITRCIHDIDGNPVTDVTFNPDPDAYVAGTPYPIKVEYYPESNFLAALGIPTDLEE